MIDEDQLVIVMQRGVLSRVSKKAFELIGENVEGKEVVVVSKGYTRRIAKMGEILKGSCDAKIIEIGKNVYRIQVKIEK
jgi:hypothetical protein